MRPAAERARASRSPRLVGTTGATAPLRPVGGPDLVRMWFRGTRFSRAGRVSPRREGARTVPAWERETAPTGSVRAVLVGCLDSTFGNITPKTKTLVNRMKRGVYEVSRRPQDAAPRDDRGPVARTVETAQTFLTASEIDALVGDYLAGAGVQELADRYGIHRATVFAHLRRRNVPGRRPGLSLNEKAEAVRLARAGISMRAIGRRMGVDRKAVRAALVEVGLLI